ncbi:dimethyl sulfoxide reductase anchor subunit [Gilliamella sp. M0320]|uniref:dimethyl sulfoxide reductase anchor subunit family protein n=1 Tax=Gilliamella sp. M0320 TaxID=2750965 RepID=UPI0018DBC805|nr:DmsC/YnfH family molybdoenzyme membrane anchor subunit [Gilliamella sp. M0320]MBI0061351.1 dimethyl sulfoxide reductase anchor subunit [Gilliamella sp. M0320]
MHELPLVFFTIFGQLSAGMILLSGLFYLVYRSKNKLAITQKINAVALIFMAIGMAIASFHLGQPLRAFNVIFGIGRSPMSNEIFTFGLLFAMTFAFVLLNYFVLYPNSTKLQIIKPLCQKINRIPRLNYLLAMILVILSLFFVWTIVLTYMLATIKTWNSCYTAIQMYTAMLVLGGIAVTWLGIYRVGYCAFFIGSLLILLLKMPYLKLMSEIAPDLTSNQYCWIIAQCALLIISITLVLFAILRKQHQTMIYLLAFIGVFIAEICGRITFYNLWMITV